MYLYLNDRVVPGEEAVVSVYDHGFLYGDGIYETVRAYGGVPLLFDQHLERLSRSASLIALDLPKDHAGIRDAVRETLEANGFTEAAVRISVTRGPGGLGLDPSLCEKPTFVIYAHEMNQWPSDYYENGVSVKIAVTRRNHPHSLDPRIKSHNFLNNILARIEADRNEYFEVIIRNLEGHLAEGTVSNLFFVYQGELCTPAVEVGILDGITREAVIRVALESGLKVREAKFRPGDLKTADEAFISSSLMEIMPVTRVGDENIAAGRVGHWTKKLMAGYRDMVDEFVKKEKGK